MEKSTATEDITRERPCKVLDCPALTEPGYDACHVHRIARRADRDGTCARCRRHLSKATDTTEASWVITVPVIKRSRRGTETTEYRMAHAYCPPRIPRVKKRNERRALIEAIEAAS